jgi:hypothetical protein
MRAEPFPFGRRNVSDEAGSNDGGSAADNAHLSSETWWQSEDEQNALATTLVSVKIRSHND